MGAIAVGVDVGGTKIQSAAMVSERIAGGHRMMTPLTGAPDGRAVGRLETCSESVSDTAPPRISSRHC